MHLRFTIEPVLNQLIDSISSLNNVEYKQKSILLNGSTIGGHTRHVIELFQCLINGYENTFINYEKRKRDLQIENNKSIACEILSSISNDIYLPNKILNLQGKYNDTEKDEYTIETNYYRELIYNLEHTIHHMALIRVAINEVSNIQLPANYGVASSTIQYKKTCAQ